jgi:2-polyprenyl-3-methyl-5-hydroxy-6-metoxy-1,4-benzoquinol methylase
VERHTTRGRALNIGIGGGGVERGLMARGWSVASLDPDARAVERLSAQGVDARQGYAQAIPFDSHTFDAVVISEVLEHIGDDVRPNVAAELARVLRPDGPSVRRAVTSSTDGATSPRSTKRKSARYFRGISGFSAARPGAS